MVKFVHLHCHTDYSLYDGFMSPEELAKRAAILEQPAVAITEHGKAGGFIKFSKACKKHNIKPIFGCEMYLSHNIEVKRDKRYHILLLAKNNEGLKNLNRLSYIGHQQSAYSFPRITFDNLKAHAEGLIVLTACINGEIPQMLIQDNEEEAFKLAKQYKEIWGDDFYLEIDWHGLSEQKKIIPGMRKISKQLGIKIVATNDCHYISKRDAKYQQYKKSISQGRPIPKTDYDVEEYYVKSYEEMAALFPGKKVWLECLHNTVEIANKCEAEIVFGKANLPEFIIEETDEFLKLKETQFKKNDEQIYLRMRAFRGLGWRGLSDKEKYVKRLEEELETIRFTGFDRYFLIVAEYCDWSRKEEIRIGCGRGSGVGSLVLYSLGVTGLDPVKYGIGMDRFLYAEAEYRIGLGDIYSDQKNEEWKPQGRGSKTRERTEEEKEKSKKVLDFCKAIVKKIEPTEEEIKRGKRELEFILTKPTIIEDILSLAKYRKEKEERGDVNNCNSFLLNLFGLTSMKADLSKDFNFEFVVDYEQSRISPPDIDIDFEHREEILKHLCDLYGGDKVALIGTANRYKPKAAVQFAAKATDVAGDSESDDRRFSSANDKEAKRISKIMPNLPGITLKQWMGEDPNFIPPNKRVREATRQMKEEKRKNPNTFDVAFRLEGKIKAYGTHAAGVVISSRPITDDIPLHVAKVQRENLSEAGLDWDTKVEEKKDGKVHYDLMTTQFDMDEVEELGLLKFDFLQLNNLRQISLTLDLIEACGKTVDFDIDNIETNDKRVFKTIDNMKLEGLFQISGDAFRGKDWHRNDKETGEKLYKKDKRTDKYILDKKGEKIPSIWHQRGVMEIIGCADFNDIVAANALGRPGPLACDMPKAYASGKKNPDSIEFKHGGLRKVLEPTYGELIYQEQLIKMAQILAGFSFSEADGLRKACAKKKSALLAEIEPKFREGCKKNKIDGDLINEMWNIAVEFGQYAFNLAHSSAYGYITYQTAYLKTYYPAEFICSLLTSAASQSDDKLEIVKEKLMEEYPKMEILSPDINASGKTYIPTPGSTDSKITIRSPFMSLKGVGVKASDAIVDVREEKQDDGFETAEDFLSVLNVKGKSLISGSLIELLVSVGCFSSLGGEEDIRKEIIRYNSMRRNKGSKKRNQDNPALEQKSAW